MSTVNVTFTKAVSLNGTTQASNSTATIDSVLAAELVYQGRATYTVAPVPAPQNTPGILITTAQLTDAGAVGTALVQSSNLDAALTALGVTLGAANSGGTGFKQLIVPNADT